MNFFEAGLGRRSQAVAHIWEVVGGVGVVVALEGALDLLLLFLSEVWHLRILSGSRTLLVGQRLSLDIDKV